MTTPTTDTTRCLWLVRGVPAWVDEAYAEDPYFEWHPDSPEDLISECGAKVTHTDEGWECERGHNYFPGRATA